MNQHNARRKEDAKTRSDWGYAMVMRHGRRRMRWGKHQMDAFDDSAFVWDVIAPILVARMPALIAPHSLAAVKTMAMAMASSVISFEFDEWQCAMSKAVGELNALDAQCSLGLCESWELLDANEYAAHSFRRKHTAKRRSLKKAQLRRAYRKHNGKGDDKRVERKMKKFAPSFRSL